MPILAKNAYLLFSVENLHILILWSIALDDRQERALQVARTFSPSRRQPALHQEGTGMHDVISTH